MRGTKVLKQSAPIPVWSWDFCTALKMELRVVCTRARITCLLSTVPLVYLNVEGRLNAAAGEAASVAKGKVLRPKHPIGAHGYRAFIEDSEGTRIALHSQST